MGKISSGTKYGVVLFFLLFIVFIYSTRNTATKDGQENTSKEVLSILKGTLTCRERISRKMYEAEAMVQNVSEHVVIVLSSAEFFDSEGHSIEKKENPKEYEERLEPGQKALVRVTILPPLRSFRDFPRLGRCVLAVHSK